MKLSILTPTFSRDKNKIKNLEFCLNKQMTGDCEWLIDDNELETTGFKRNKLLLRSSGEYIIFIDADDDLTHNAIELIMISLKSNPDCVGYNSIRHYSDGRKKLCEYKLGNRWSEDNEKIYRPIWHLNPIKREIGIKFKFINMTRGEDSVWSAMLQPALKTTIFIPEVIYNYYIRG